MQAKEQTSPKKPEQTAPNVNPQIFTAQSPQQVNGASPNMISGPMPTMIQPNFNAYIAQHPNQPVPVQFMGQIIMMPQMGMRPQFVVNMPMAQNFQTQMFIPQQMAKVEKPNTEVPANAEQPVSAPAPQSVSQSAPQPTPQTSVQPNVQPVVQPNVQPVAQPPPAQQI